MASISKIYAETAFVAKGGNPVIPAKLVKTVQDSAITRTIITVRVADPGSGSTPEVDDPTGRTWAFEFAGADALSGSDEAALDAIVAAYTGSEADPENTTTGGSAGQVWGNIGGTSYGWVTPPGAGGGEANTTSNAGATGFGLALAKEGTDLPIAKIAVAGSLTGSQPVNTLTIDGSALLPRDGSRAMTGALDMGAAAITNVGNVDGRDVSADGSALDSHVGNTAIHVPALGTALQVFRVNAGATATEWADPAATGVGGNLGANDNRVARSDGVGGVTLQGSVVEIDDTGAVTGVTTITASGAISASNISGTNTGDQTITLTGDVGGSGTGSFAATIASNAVSYAKMQDVSAASRLIGRGSAAGAGDPEEIDVAGGIVISGTTLTTSGLVGGALGSNDNRLMRVDGSGGVTAQGSAITVDDSGNMSGVGTIASGAITVGSGNVTLTTGNIVLSQAGATVDGVDLTAQASTISSHTGNAAIHVPALGTAGQVLAVNSGATGTEWVAASGGSSGVTHYILTANRSVTSAEADVTDWTGITLEASKYYKVTMMMAYSNSAATVAGPGIGFFFTNTPSNPCFWMYNMLSGTTDNDRTGGSDAVMAAGTVTTNGVTLSCFICGVFKANATPGTMKVRSSCGSGNTSTLYEGSVLTLEKLN